MTGEETKTEIEKLKAELLAERVKLEADKKALADATPPALKPEEDAEIIKLKAENESMTKDILNITKKPLIDSGKFKKEDLDKMSLSELKVATSVYMRMLPEVDKNKALPRGNVDTPPEEVVKYRAPARNPRTGKFDDIGYD